MPTRQIKRKIFSLRKILFMLALVFLSVSILIGQSVGKDKPACPKIDKIKIREEAKDLKVQRSGKTPSVFRYSYEKGEKIPNYM